MKNSARVGLSSAGTSIAEHGTRWRSGGPAGSARLLRMVTTTDVSGPDGCPAGVGTSTDAQT